MRPNLRPVPSCVVLVGLLGVSCTDRTPAPPAPRAAAPAPTDGCGPAVEDQIDNVRVAVLEEMMARAARDAAAGPATLGQIVIAEEQRLQPGGQVFVHDASPAVAAHFAGRTPPVENYSSAFQMDQGHTVRKENQTAFSTGDICWSSPTRAMVAARTLTGAGNRRSTAKVERSGDTWRVTSLEPRR